MAPASSGKPCARTMSAGRTAEPVPAHRASSCAETIVVKPIAGPDPAPGFLSNACPAPMVYSAVKTILAKPTAVRARLACRPKPDAPMARAVGCARPTQVPAPVKATACLAQEGKRVARTTPAARFAGPARSAKPCARTAPVGWTVGPRFVKLIVLFARLEKLPVWTAAAATIAVPPCSVRLVRACARTTPARWTAVR